MKLLFLSAALLLMPAPQTTASNAPATKPPDYADPANWACRPGAETICTSGLDAEVVSANGTRVAEPFKPAADPPIDCFYVYPTASREQTMLSDLANSPEIQKTVNAQAGRLTSRCRVFVPIYRQATLKRVQQPLDDSVWETPGQDITAAWQYYLQHDNRGRGVVLVGHSQGTILLQALIAKSIDGTPAQALLVSAFLAGDPSLAVPPGADVGGTFKHIPVCRAAAQTGCAYAWGSYLAEDATPQQVFGAPRNDGMVSACSSPAAPSGGSGKLKPFYPGGSQSGPVWAESLGIFSGSCIASASGDGFRVSVEDVPSAPLYHELLVRSQIREGWGLHTLDIALVQGNILDVLDAEITAWKKAH